MNTCPEIIGSNSHLYGEALARHTSVLKLGQSAMQSLPQAESIHTQEIPSPETTQTAYSAIVAELGLELPEKMNLGQLMSAVLTPRYEHIFRATYALYPYTHRHTSIQLSDLYTATSHAMRQASHRLMKLLRSPPILPNDTNHAYAIITLEELAQLIKDKGTAIEPAMLDVVQAFRGLPPYQLPQATKQISNDHNGAHRTTLKNWERETATALINLKDSPNPTKPWQKPDRRIFVAQAIAANPQPLSGSEDVNTTAELSSTIDKALLEMLTTIYTNDYALLIHVAGVNVGIDPETIVNAGIVKVLKRLHVEPTALESATYNHVRSYVLKAIATARVDEFRNYQNNVRDNRALDDIPEALGIVSSFDTANQAEATVQVNTIINKVRSLGIVNDETLRTIILAKAYGLTDREVSEVLNIKIGTVKSRVSLGLRAIRAAIESDTIAA